jgi:hypothetical protein
MCALVSHVISPVITEQVANIVNSRSIWRRSCEHDHEKPGGEKDDASPNATLTANSLVERQGHDLSSQS